jgi:flagellar motor switch/type III secretory pathway protein FliN
MKLVIYKSGNAVVVVIVDCETRKLFLGSPILSAKLPAYRINWLSIGDIRYELKKYSNEDETGKKIEEDLSSLLSNFSTSEIRFALVATLAKLELDIKDLLPLRKNKLIELFSQLIFDNMSILVNLTKTTKQYM